MVVLIWEKLQTGLATASLGDGISLVAAIGFAGYTVLNKRLVARYTVTAVMTWTLIMRAIPALGDFCQRFYQGAARSNDYTPGILNEVHREKRVEGTRHARSTARRDYRRL